MISTRSQTRSKHKVPPEGPLDARIAIVGESPGRNEWRRGRPFIGDSGDILDDALRGIGVDRKDVYVTNVIKDDLPPSGGGTPAQRAAIKRQFFFKHGHPTQTYLEGILHVHRELREVGANVVVTLGNYALWALMQHESIMKWRGSILESPLLVDPETGQGQKVIPIIHPAFFINARNQWYKQVLIDWDFQRVLIESKSPEIILPAPEIIVNPSPAEIDTAVDRFRSVPFYAWDTEWYGPDELAYVGFSDSKDYAFVIPYNSQQAIAAYRAIFESDTSNVHQNGWAFDIPAMHRMGIEVVGPSDDTMVEWNSCWASLRAKSLAMQCSLLTRHPYYKDEVEFVGKNDVFGQQYCGTDCVVTYEAHDRIVKEEMPITLGHIGYAITKSVAPFFIEATGEGILIDDEKRIKLKDIHLERANEIEDALGQTIGYTINCRSPQQVNDLVHDKLLPMFGMEPVKRTSRQEYLMNIAGSTDNKELQTILGAVIRVRQNRNIVSRYLHDGVVDVDGRARTNWNLAGTRAARFSSTIPWWNGLAFQTVPDDARVIFIADPGYVFIGFDYDQAEARVVAVLTYNYDLLDDMAAGIDIHAKLVEQMPMFDLTYDVIKAECDALEAQNKSKDECRPRFLMKKSRHAFNYVEGPDTFALHINREWLDTGIGINRSEARIIRKEYLTINEGLEPWWKEVRSTCLSDGYMDNAFDRRRMVLGRFDDDANREMVSFYPQSTIADLCTQSIAKICRRLPRAKVNLHMHDGAMFQVPYDGREEAYTVMLEEAEWPITVKGQEITIPVSGKMGYNWGEMGRPF